MEAAYNTRNPAVKRLMQEARELCTPTELYFAHPLEDNLFEWHFTVRGPPDTEFDGGVYHGRIILPAEYPMKPPSIMLLTPNGRFELNKKICLSISGYHPESWQPSWSIRTALLAIIGFMPTPGVGALGALDYTPQERKVLAAKSRTWKCSICGAHMANTLPNITDASTSSQSEAKQLASQISFQNEPSKNEAAEGNNPVIPDDNVVVNPAGNPDVQPEVVVPVTNPVQSVPLPSTEPELPPISRTPRFQLEPAPLPRVQSVEGSAGGSFTTFLLWSALVALAALLFRRLMILTNAKDETDAFN